MANSEKELLGDLLLGNFGKLHKGDTVTIIPAPRTGDTISLLQTMVERHFGIDMVPEIPRQRGLSDPNTFYLHREGDER
jgi:hypothetical protein